MALVAVALPIDAVTVSPYAKVPIPDAVVTVRVVDAELGLVTLAAARSSVLSLNVAVQPDGLPGAVMATVMALSV